MRRHTQKNRQSGSRVLFVVALFLVASASLRLVSDIGPAVAQEIANGESPNENLVPSTVTSADVDAALSLVRAREDAVLEREREVELRLAVLELAEAEFKATTMRMDAAEERLRETLAQTETAAENDISRLTSVYENMQPDAAVPLFQKMDADFAAGFLARMRPDAAAQILAGLEADQAYAISVILAGRNALAGQITE